jgi:hypothetical protein
MRPSIIVSLTGIAGAILLTASSRLPVSQDTEPEEITRFDSCLQLRFLDRKSFGMQRVAPRRYHGARFFHAENQKEQAVVSEMQAKGYELAVYLAGRGMLSPDPLTERSNIQGPAFITKLQNTDNLPSREALRDESLKMLLSEGKEDFLGSRQGEWRISMHRLRASNEGCVGCHTSGGGSAAYRQSEKQPLKLGDTIGVAIYVYRRAPAAQRR